MPIKTLALAKWKLRQDLRKLLLGKTEAGDNVFVSRTTRLDRDLPAILIYPNNEPIEQFQESPKRYKRSFGIRIEVIAAEATDQENDKLVEIIAEQVEFLIETHETDEKTFGEIIEAIRQTNAQYSFDANGQTPTMSLILDFDFIYLSTAITEDFEALDTFKGAKIEWKIGHNNASPDTGDNLDADGDGDDGSVKATDEVNVTT